MDYFIVLLLRSVVGIAHVLRSVLVMGYAAKQKSWIVLGHHLVELLSTPCRDSVATIANFATVDMPSLLCRQLEIRCPLSRQSRHRGCDSRQAKVCCDNSSTI